MFYGNIVFYNFLLILYIWQVYLISSSLTSGIFVNSFTSEISAFAQNASSSALQPKIHDEMKTDPIAQQLSNGVSKGSNTSITAKLINTASKCVNSSICSTVVPILGLSVCTLTFGPGCVPVFDPFFKRAVESQNVLFVSDRTFAKDPFVITKTNNGVDHIERIFTLCRYTHPIAYVIDSTGRYNNPYQYPYTSLQVMVQNENRGQGLVQIRTNYQ
jgi:hypothetical protein